MTRGPHLTLNERRGPSCFRFTFWIGFRSKSNDCHLLTLLPPPVPSPRTPPPPPAGTVSKIEQICDQRGPARDTLPSSEAEAGFQPSLAQPPVRHRADHTHGSAMRRLQVPLAITPWASVRNLLISLQILRGESIPGHTPAPVDLTLLCATFITASASVAVLVSPAPSAVHRYPW